MLERHQRYRINAVALVPNCLALFAAWPRFEADTLVNPSHSGFSRQLYDREFLPLIAHRDENDFIAKFEALRFAY